LSVRLALIAAVARNGVIGDGPVIPWRLSTDMKRFRSLTMGKPVIVGRKTFDTFGKPLPGRKNIIVSRTPRPLADDVAHCSSLDAALDYASAEAGRRGVDEVMVAGGGEVYAGLMNRADRLYITHVDAEPAGDSRFPSIDPATWRIVEEMSVPAGPRDDHASRFAIYDRRHGAGDG